MSASLISTKGEKSLTLENMVLKNDMLEKNVKYCGTNAGHQLADGFTKLLSAGARSDLLGSAIEQAQVPIISFTDSGRNESQEEHAKHKATMYSLDDDECDEEAVQNVPTDVDDLRQWYFDLC